MRHLDIALECDESLAFDLGGENQIGVSIRRLTKSARGQEYTTFAAFSVATGLWQPSNDITAALRDLSECRLPSGTKLENGDWHKGWDHLFVDGKLKPNTVLPLEVLSDELRSFVDETKRTLWAAARETVRVLRWRVDAEGQHYPFVGYAELDGFSFDGYEWFKVPASYSVSVSVRSHPRVSRQSIEDVERYVGSSLSEPLPHLLFREAWDQRQTNPRSALVIGVAAVEAGIKQLATNLVPETNWLFENLPSPPVHLLLGQYLPTLPVRLKLNGEAKRPHKSTLTTVQRAVEARNKIVHLGEIPEARRDLVGVLERRTLESTLLAIRDVLWLLDYYSGFEWAIEHIRPDYRP